MLNKLLVHIKNVLFFKTVVYLLIIVCLLILVPIFQKDLDLALAQKEKSTIFLHNVDLKLDSIDHFKNEITAINARYDKLINIESGTYCANRLNLMRSIANLADKYNLNQPITQTISRGYEYEKDLISGHNLYIQYHIIDLSFNVIDEFQALLITQDIYKMLPKNSLILEQVITKPEELTPAIAMQLAYGKAPNLMNITMKIMLRDVTYKK